MLVGWGGGGGSFQNVKLANSTHLHLVLALNKTGTVVQRNTVSRSRNHSHGRPVLHILGSLSYTACKAHAHHYMSSVACLTLPYFSTLSHKR